MKIFCVSILSATWSLSTGFCPTTGRPSRVTTPWSFRQPTCSASITALHAVDNKEPASADALLKMVEDISGDQFSQEVVAKMSELEQVLTFFLENEKKKEDAPSPRPPGIPPPLNAFDQREQEEEANSLLKAGEALEKLRQRLREQEEALVKAEEALKRSIEEDEVLCKAEEALQKSRAAAEKRKSEAIRRTEAAVASSEKARKEAAQQDEDNAYDKRRTRGTIAINKPRPTISLASFLYGGSGKEKNEADPSSDCAEAAGADDAPAGIPILCNWVQNIDGSITGRLEGSRNFKEGVTVSTSPVPSGAQGGSVITTASGSKYYLERLPTKKGIDNQKALETKRAKEAAEKAVVDSSEKARKEAAQKGKENVYDERRTRGTIAINKPRPTISLSSFLYGGSGKEKNEADPSGDGAEAAGADDAPAGIPILYHWVQNIDGSITGRLEGSRNFKEGATVSTSPVSSGAQGGSVITTASGSKYYLEKRTTKKGIGNQKSLETKRAKETAEKATAERRRLIDAKNKEAAAEKAAAEQRLRDTQSKRAAAEKAATEQRLRDDLVQKEAEEAARRIRRKEEEARKEAARNIRIGQSQKSSPKTATPPQGVPSILSWEIQEDGGIAGLIYGSPNADDGDYIETSPIANGSIESGRVVKTSSGSRYFLSADKAEKDLNVLAAFKDLAAARRGGTITITKEVKEQRAKEVKEQRAKEAVKKLEQATPRSTFSLFDLFGPKEPFQAPANGKKAPSGVPTLSRWSANDDGTITGVISGSANIEDGDLVTTSPIATGKMKTSETVTTVSGSAYYLG